MKVGDFQWLRIPPGQSVARPEATRATKDSRKGRVALYAGDDLCGLRLRLLEGFGRFTLLV